MMGGRAGEKLVYGDLSTGAQNDLQQATALARRMVEEFGMSERVGPVALARTGLYLPVDGRPVDLISPEEAGGEIKRLLEAAERRAEALLADRRPPLPRPPPPPLPP